jgi:hypothetical protein
MPCIEVEVYQLRREHIASIFKIKDEAQQASKQQEV